VRENSMKKILNIFKRKQTGKTEQTPESEKNDDDKIFELAKMLFLEIKSKKGVKKNRHGMITFHFWVDDDGKLFIADGDNGSWDIRRSYK
jgi:hypothetical protein